MHDWELLWMTSAGCLLIWGQFSTRGVQSKASLQSAAVLLALYLPTLQGSSGLSAQLRHGTAWHGSARPCSMPGCRSASSGRERSQLRSCAFAFSFVAHWLHTGERLQKGMVFSENSESIRCHCLPFWILVPMLGMCVRDSHEVQIHVWTVHLLLNFSNYISKLWELTRKVVLDVATTSCQK